MSFSFGSVASSVKLPVSGLIFQVDCASDVSYPNAGTIWTDVSTSKLTGSLSGTTLPSFTASNGGYLSFDGATSYVTYGDRLDMLTNNRTVIAWFYPTSIPASNRYIAGKSTTGAFTQGRYAMFMNAGKLTSLYTTGSTAATNFTVSSSTTMTTNTWYMGTLVIDRPNASMSLYLNTTFEANTTIPTTTVSLDNGVNLVVGGVSNLAAATFFPGRIATVAIYNRALTSTEITNIYNLTKNRYI